MVKQICQFCQENLPSHMDLRIHVLKFHPSQIKELTLVPRYQKNVECTECTSKFRSNESLKRHIRNVHPTKYKVTESVDDIKPKISSKEPMKCSLCDYKTSLKCSYRKHVRKKHPENADNLITISRVPKHDKKCPLCSYSNISKEEIHNHFVNDHRIKIQKKYFNFSSLSQFFEWKNTMEKDTTCKYVQNSKATTECGKRVTYRYICHRSGYARTAGKGVRKAKYKGSNKINGFCPSELLVISDEDNCEVEYVKTHIGHSNEIQRITLTSEERDYLALKIANGVSFDKILEEARATKGETSVDRLQLLTRKDLFNIAKRYSLFNSAVLTEERDIDTWVKETEGILFYKREGEECPQHSFLSKTDFILILMNASQREIFSGNYDDLVCIDSLTGANERFDLFTIMVRDNALNGFPCAFMFSSRNDQLIMELYFSYVKEKIGTVSVKALMGDLNDTIYNAWMKIFGPPQRRLYCSWLTDKAWRNRLNKVKPTEERRMIYTLLKNLQTESIEHKFEKMLNEFLTTQLIDTELKSYFVEDFVPCAKLWASCYRIEDRINEDSQLQQLHEHLKYICTYGKTRKPIDKILSSVTRMVSDNLVSRKVVLSSNETVYHLNLIQKRHRDSYLGSFDSVIKVAEGWHVSSFTELNEPYELFFVQQVLDMCNCNYSCSECHTCIHQFACSCVDHAVENNMCKHIHLVIRYRDGKKHFILDEGNGIFKDIDSENEHEADELGCYTSIGNSNQCTNEISQNKTDTSKSNINDIMNHEITGDNHNQNNSAVLNNREENQPKVLLDTNELEVSVISVTSDEEKLQNKKRLLIDAITKQIERVESLQQLNALELVLAQVIDQVDELKM